MRSSGSMLITCLAVLILGPVLALANGFYTPVVGPRAGALGGAFIGLADDYSAVYWNPAGITQIKGMELTATGHDVVSLASREGFAVYEGYGGAADRFAWAQIGATSQTTNRIAPGMFFLTDAGPLRSVFDKVGIAAYTLTEYGSKWDGDDVFSNDDFIGHQHDFDYRFLAADMQDYESRMKTYLISPILAKEVLPGLSVGVTANLAYSHFTLKDVYMATSVDTFETPEPEDDYLLAITPVQLTDDVTGWGYGATVGILYRATRRISAGLTVRTPMKMAYEGTYGIMASGGGEVYREQHKLDFEMKLPMWVGAGFAVRDALFDGLTLTGDAHWTNWSTLENIDRNIAWGASSELPEDVPNEFDTTDLNWDDTLEVAIGFDYRLGRSLSIDMGYRNSPSPVPEGRDDWIDTYDFILPQTAKNVMSMGVTYRQDFWRASFGLEYHAGQERRITQTADMNGKHIDDLLIPSLSFTYAF